MKTPELPILIKDRNCDAKNLQSLNHYRGIIFGRLIGLIYRNKFSRKAKHFVSTLCDRNIRIAILSFLSFSLSLLLGILFIFLSLSFHLSAFPLRFRLALATHSPDIERTSRGLLPRTGGCSCRGWLAGSLLQSRSLTYLSPLLGREIESVLFAMLCYSPSQLHLLLVYLWDRIQNK